MSASHVILVGHCTPDVFMLQSALGRALPDATFVAVNDGAALERERTPDSLLLVNRILDGRFPHATGIELIADLKARDENAIALLVSDLPHAQEEAERAGARPGFGKRALYDDETARRVSAAFAV